MKAELIEERQRVMREQGLKGDNDASMLGVCFWLSELCLQVAKANEHLAKIANPLIEVAESPWVWLTFNGKPFVVDRHEVTGVAPVDVGSNMPFVQIGMKGQPWSKAADGTVAEVCAKLGIPVA